MNMETPRTDKAVKESNGQWSYALVNTCKQLERELAASKQIMGELCDSCGWAMRFPDQPCRCQLERELAEARDQLEGARKLMTACDVLVRDLAEARKQRDALINILTDVINEDGTAKSIDRASILLTAVKGGIDE